MLLFPLIGASFPLPPKSEISRVAAWSTRRQSGFIGRTPLCFGFLSGTIDHNTAFPPGDHRLGWSRVQLENWIDGARDPLDVVDAAPGLQGVQAALRCCLSFPAVATVIPGILTAAEAEENALASAAGPLQAEEVDTVLAINRQREFFVAPVRAS